MKKKKPANKKGNIMGFIKFLSFISPLIIYLLLILWVFPAPNSGFIALGVLGSFIVGLGVVNIAGLLDDMYLGHIVTAVCMIVGGGLVLISSLIMYIPPIYSQIDEKNVTFYFVIWTLLIVSGLYYLFFRHAVSLDLQKNGLSKTKIKKSMTGIRGYWWYCDLKNSMTYQWTYGVNKLFTIFFPCVSILHLMLGWWRVLFPIVGALVLFLLMLNVMMYWLVFTTWDQGHNDHRRKSSSVIVGGFILPIAGCVGLIIYMVELL